MASTSVTIPKLPAFVRATVDAPKLQLRYMRTALSRGVKRIRKHFIKTQLHGPPGIHAEGKLSKGKNVFAVTRGRSLQSLSAFIGISRILHVHERGLTISATSGLLYLHARGTGPVKDRPIVAAVPQVVIPSRLRFRQQVSQEAPAMLRKVGEAGTRATVQTFRQAIGG